MKACVIGGGPSGIFVSNYLNKNGIPVDLYEKSSSLLGNYKYARDKVDILKNFNANVHLNSDETSIDDSNCDFYVVTTGGKEKKLEIEGKEHALSAMNVIENIYSRNINSTLPDRYKPDVCIIGMGNVSLDLAYYLKNIVKSVTILSRNDISNASFSNHVMRELLKDNFYDVKLIDGNIIKTDNLKAKKRYEMFEKSESFIDKALNYLKKIAGLKSKPSLNLIFNSEPKKIKKIGNLFGVEYLNNKSIKNSVFDAVISSIGFLPNVPVLNTKKPIFYSGWCSYSRGNLGDAMINAKNTVNHILKDKIEQPLLNN